MVDEFIAFSTGLVIGLLVMDAIMVGIIVAIDDINYRHIDELGQSICHQEYGMDFEDYRFQTLTCKTTGSTYDGIKVKIGGQLKNESISIRR